MRKLILVIMSILVLMILVGCDKDPEGLAPPGGSSTVGQADYTSAPLTLSQLNSGVSLDSGWNAFIWTDELSSGVSVTDALNSVSSSYYYIYSYNEQKYYFNPNERYAQYNSHSYYSTRLISELKPSHKYGMYMASSGTLRYTTSVSSDNVKITLLNGSVINVTNTTIIQPNGTIIVPPELGIIINGSVYNITNVSIVTNNTVITPSNPTIVTPNGLVYNITNTSIVQPNGTVFVPTNPVIVINNTIYNVTNTTVVTPGGNITTPTNNTNST